MSLDKKILYVGSMGRSGSTIVSNMIGQIDGYMAVGELHNIFDRGMQQNWLCGCGSPFADCTVWKAVMTRVKEQVGEERLRNAPGVVTSVRRWRHFIPLLLLVNRSLGMRFGKVQEYCNLFHAVYEAIFSVVDAQVIVDSSKVPLHASLLGAMDRSWRVYLLHLVRDSRAVAFSRKRKKVNKNVTGQLAFMKVRGSVTMSLAWMWRNILLDFAGGLCDSKSRLRYDQFVENPRAEITRIRDWSGSNAEVGFIRDNKATLRPTHAFSGNPSRFDGAEVTVKMDDEWRTAMRPFDKFVVTVITCLANLRYMRFGLSN